MSLSIKNGDFLVVGAAEYPIRAAGQWPLVGWGPIGFGSAQLTSGCSVKRYKSDDTEATIASSLSIMPLMPVSPETVAALPQIASPHQVKETYFYDETDLWHVIVQVAD